MLLDHELARDDVDLFALVGLTTHLLKRALAKDAHPIRLGELVNLFDDA